MVVAMSNSCCENTCLSARLLVCYAECDARSVAHGTNLILACLPGFWLAMPSAMLEAWPMEQI